MDRVWIVIEFLLMVAGAFLFGGIVARNVQGKPPPPPPIEQEFDT